MTRVALRGFAAGALVGAVVALLGIATVWVALRVLGVLDDLQALSRRLVTGIRQEAYLLRDANGNTVGEAQFHLEAT